MLLSGAARRTPYNAYVALLRRPQDVLLTLTAWSAIPEWSFTTRRAFLGKYTQSTHHSPFHDDTTLYTIHVRSGLILCTRCTHFPTDALLRSALERAKREFFYDDERWDIRRHFFGECALPGLIALGRSWLDVWCSFSSIEKSLVYNVRISSLQEDDGQCE